MKRTRELLTLVLPLMAAGCDTGNILNPPPPPPVSVDPEGIYAGAVTSSTDNGNSVLGIVAADGTARFVEFAGSDLTTFPAMAVISPQNLVADSSGTFSQSFIAYSDGGFVLPSGNATDVGTFSGAAAAITSINGSYTYSASGTSIAYATTYQPSSYEVASSGQTIAGNYVVTFMVGTNTVVASLNIVAGSTADTATVSGGVTSGDTACVLNGTISIPDTTRNAYEMALIATSCSNPQDDFVLSGLASYLSINSSPGVLAILSDSNSGTGVVMLMAPAA